MKDAEPQFIISHAATGRVIKLPREGEDLLIAILLELVRDATVLDAEIVYEDVFDADEVY